MTFTSIETRYLTSQQRGCLATVAPDGTPQNKPVGFRCNAALGTIDIYGYAMEGSAKFRNIQVNPDVAFVVDDVISDEASGVRFLEIRGDAEAVSDPAPAAHLSAQFIRIHPRRVISWNVDPGHPGLLARDVAASGRSGTEGEPG